MIFDTTFLIDLLKNNPSAKRKAQEMDQSNQVVATTTITLYESWRGLYDAPEKQNALNEILGELRLLTLTEKSAKKAAEIEAELIRSGEQIDAVDCMIAAIAMENRETLLTRNVRHFSRIFGLKVETY